MKSHPHPLRLLVRLNVSPGLLLAFALSAPASDWPAYRHDARRSAVSTDRLTFPLGLAWHHKSRHAPRPAFADPLSHPTGIDFAYIRDHSEPVILDFDYAFHPVAAGGRVFYGSSADDAVRCLSLATGEQQWVFVTGGPVRFAPEVVGDRLYVASDDGFVYCLAAESGKLIWQFRAAPSARQLVGNGRMISRWPLRTGALVLDGTLYVTAGMWPAEGVFVYALDAATGAVKWVNDTSGTFNRRTASVSAYTITGVAPTGYLLAGSGGLVVPTGRSAPASYALKDGRLLGSTAPSYQNRRGGPAVCIDQHGSLIFGYPRERLTRTSYSIHYAYRLPMLQQFGTMRADRVLADERTYVTVNDQIRCYDASSRYTKVKVLWQADCPSRRLRCMALSVNSLVTGVDNRVVARDRRTGEMLWEQSNLDGYVRSVAIADSQLLVATDAGSIYCFSVNGSKGVSSDTSPSIVETEPVNGDLRNALDGGRINRGLALVIGHTDLTLAARLAANTHLQVVLLLDDADAVTAARRDLLERMIPTQGKVSVQQHVRDKPLPFADYAFNVIVATGETAIRRAAELHRVLAPAGGILFIEKATAEVESLLGDNGTSADEIRRAGNALILRRGKLAGALDWDSDHRNDERVKWPLELLWFGGPGSKRTGSGSRPPVAAGGRNFVIGKNHLIALDAYNGTELWARTLPYLYRNIGRLRNAPGPINPWLTKSISADYDHAYLNFGHVVYTLDAATGEQQAVHGEFPTAKHFSLKDRPQFSLDHYQKPDIRSVASVTTKAPQPAGSIQLAESEDGKELKVTLQLAPSVEVTDKVYWELFFDVRAPSHRVNLYEKGIFHFLVKPAASRVELGIGPAHPKVVVASEDDGRHMELTIPLQELIRLSGGRLKNFSFAAALNHQPGPEQKAMANGRGYLRWEVHCDTFAYAFNNGWARIVRSESTSGTIQLPAVSKLPEHALRPGRMGWIGKKAGSVVSLKRDRKNPLSHEVAGFEYNRGKGCGNPVASGSLHVLRSGTLAFYDLNDDSGMRYFGGVRPSCTISAAPAQGLVFAAEGSSGCNCNYNFKTTLALAPAKRRRHEDWAMFMAPLTPAALLRTGRFNIAAPGDRRDDRGGLWLQLPRAPTYANRSMPVPVELRGDSLKPYRVNADRVPIAGTDRPWLYTSGFEGIGGVRLQLFMSDKDGAVVFPGEAPVLDAVLEDKAWERRYAVPAGKGSSMFLSYDKNSLFAGFEVVPPIDRRGEQQPWKTTGELPHDAEFALDEPADDTAVWNEDSLEFLVSDTSLQTILHFGLGITGGRYDGRWTAAKKVEDPAYTAPWAGAIEVDDDIAVAELALPWKTLADAGLDLENLVIRPRTKRTLTRQPHITHGFRPVLVQKAQPREKRYRVSLHFAELGDAAKGERIFDIQIQGKTVEKNFDPVAAAGGPKRAVVRVFENILADRAMDIRFVRHADASPTALPPSLAAVEVLLVK
ncbi:MAG: PQQ-binding-like beta-propeller repeat protein [Planctomycetota bacterium]|nr:PQQ-binding-like beta-propeller repeat protein [Planctomycetota bacterium]